MFNSVGNNTYIVINDHFLTIVHEFVCSRIDCCNSGARMIARLPPYSHISDYIINDLHWLPVLAHVWYKVLLLVVKSQQGLAPKYLWELMSKLLSAYSSLLCALLIAVTFLYLGPILLYLRTGLLLGWVQHSGMPLPLQSGVWCYRGYHLSLFVVWRLFFSPACHSE